jgi:hypothetical protein
MLTAQFENLPAAFRQLDEEDGAREDANIEITRQS